MTTQSPPAPPTTTHYIAHVDYNIDERGGWGRYATIPQFQDDGHWEITPVQVDELALRTTILCLEDIADEVRSYAGWHTLGKARAELGPDPCQQVEIDILTPHAGLLTIVRHPDFEGNNAEFHTLLHCMIRKFKDVRFAFETRANTTKAFRSHTIGS